MMGRMNILGMFCANEEEISCDRKKFIIKKVSHKRQLLHYTQLCGREKKEWSLITLKRK